MLTTAFELAVLFAGLASAVDAFRSDARWRAVLASAFLYALTFEWLVTSRGEGGFGYGEFLVPALGGAPLWVPVGWACLLYAAMRTAERWKVRWPWLAAAGLVGVVGWQLEPVALAFRWWGWSAPGQPLVLGTPTGTHLSWIFVGLAYTSVAYLGWRFWKDQWWVPFMAGPLGLVLVGLGTAAAGALGQAIGHEWALATIEALVLGGALFLFVQARRVREKPRPLVLFVPIVTTLGCLAGLVASEIWHAGLVVGLASVGSLLVHGYFRAA